MSMPSNCTGRYATWTTDKTVVDEAILVGPHGILSLKVVTSANGHKVNVFSGFDTSSWDWSDELNAAMLAGPAVWDHKYIKAQNKALDKWEGGPICDLAVAIPERLLTQLPDEVQTVLDEAIRTDLKVREQWQMFTGEVAAISSARGASKDPVTPKKVPGVESRQDRHERALLEDPMYGIL